MDKNSINNTLKEVYDKLRWAQFHFKCENDGQSVRYLKDIKEILLRNIP